jgi:hypothetical protein
MLPNVYTEVHVRAASYLGGSGFKSRRPTDSYRNSISHGFPHSLNENVEIPLAVGPPSLTCTNFEINYCQNNTGNIIRIT